MKHSSAMNGNRLAVLFVILTVANGVGCNRYWVNPDGITSFDKDSYECKMETSFVRHSGSSSATADSEDYRSNASYNTSLDYDTDLYESCMNARGYRLVSERELQASREREASAGGTDQSSQRTDTTSVRKPTEREIQAAVDQATEQMGQERKLRFHFCEFFGLTGATPVSQAYSLLSERSDVVQVAAWLEDTDYGPGTKLTTTYNFMVNKAGTADDEHELTVVYSATEGGLRTELQYVELQQGRPEDYDPLPVLSNSFRKQYEQRFKWIGVTAETLKIYFGEGNTPEQYYNFIGSESSALGTCDDGSTLAGVGFYSDRPWSSGSNTVGELPAWVRLEQGAVGRVAVTLLNEENTLPTSLASIYPEIDVSPPGGYVWGSPPPSDAEPFSSDGDLVGYDVKNDGTNGMSLRFCDERLGQVVYWGPGDFDATKRLFSELYGPGKTYGPESEEPPQHWWSLRRYAIKASAYGGGIAAARPDLAPGVQVNIQDREIVEPCVDDFLD